MPIDNLDDRDLDDPVVDQICAGGFEVEDGEGAGEVKQNVIPVLANKVAARIGEVVVKSLPDGLLGKPW